MSVLEDTIKYYTDLLLYQYINSTKARSTISLLASQALVDLLPIEMNLKFDIETAIGDQLDILGEYIGLSRYINADVIRDYFIFANQISLPSSYIGMTDYLDPIININSSFYSYKIQKMSIYTLIDDEYRILLKLKLLMNVSTNSLSDIDNKLYSIFSNDVYTIDLKNMTMVYVVNEIWSRIINIAFDNNILPKPMGVALLGVYPETVWNSFWSIYDYGYASNLLINFYGGNLLNETLSNNYQIGQTFVATSIYLNSITIEVSNKGAWNLIGSIGAKIYDVDSNGFPVNLIKTSINSLDASICKGIREIDFALIESTFNFDNIIKLNIGTTYAVVFYVITPLSTYYLTPSIGLYTNDLNGTGSINYLTNGTSATLMDEQGEVIAATFLNTSFNFLTSVDIWLKTLSGETNWDLRGKIYAFNNSTHLPGALIGEISDIVKAPSSGDYSKFTFIFNPVPLSIDTRYYFGFYFYYRHAGYGKINVLTDPNELETTEYSAILVNGSWYVRQYDRMRMGINLAAGTDSLYTNGKIIINNGSGWANRSYNADLKFNLNFNFNLNTPFSDYITGYTDSIFLDEQDDYLGI